MSEPKEDFYLITMLNDVDPCLSLPFKTLKKVTEAAGHIRHRTDRHGVYWLAVPHGTPTPQIGSFCGKDVDW